MEQEEGRNELNFPETALQKHFTTAPFWRYTAIQTGTPVALGLLPLLHGKKLGSVEFSGFVELAFYSFLVLLLVYGTALAVGAKWRKDQEISVDEAIRRNNSDQEHQVLRLLNEINMTIAHVLKSSDNLATKTQRAGLLGPRATLLMSARNMIGPDDGVRANLFEVDGESNCIVPAKSGSTSGVHEQSRREFGPGDETYRQALAGRTRFEKDTAQLEEDVPYGTFLVAPIITGQRLFGLITVDSPDSGDLTEYDEKLLIQYASQLAVTFALDRDNSSSIDLRSDVQTLAEQNAREEASSK